MRLRDYQNKLKSVLADIENLAIKTETPNALILNEVTIKGLNNFNKGIKLLQELKLFNKITADFNNSIFSNRIEDSFIIDNTKAKILQELRKQLIADINNLLIIIDSIIKDEDSNIINIKVPESVSSLSDLKEFINNLDLMCCIFKEFACDIKFKGVYSGSVWFALLIGIGTFAKPCINFLFDIADKALILRNKKLDGDRKLLEIEELKQNLDMQQYENIYNIRKLKNEEEYTVLKVELAKKALDILNKTEQHIANKNEVLEKAKFSIEKMGELLDKGMEIQPAFNASEDVLQLSEQFKEKLEKHKNHVIGLNSQKLIESEIDNSEKESEDKS